MLRSLFFAFLYYGTLDSTHGWVFQIPSKPRLTLIPRAAKCDFQDEEVKQLYGIDKLTDIDHFDGKDFFKSADTAPVTGAKQGEAQKGLKLKKSDISEVAVNLLSFDGGGVKGLFSIRALTLVLQGLLVDKTKAGWISDAQKYVQTLTCGDGYKTRWLVWAQQMDAMQVKPQEPGKVSWLSYSWDDPLARQLVDIDIFFEYYLTHVVAISGTSTGGLITGAIALGMTLTQLAALYMDPESCKMIFPPFTLNILRWNGWFNAKYTQDGIKNLIKKIFQNVSPCDEAGEPSSTTFMQVAEAYNERLERKILGSPWMDQLDEHRMRLTLEAGLKKKNLNVSAAPDMIKSYKESLAKASVHLTKPRRLRTVVAGDSSSTSHNDAKLLSSPPSLNWLNTTELITTGKKKNIFTTRFLVTARCANNAGAVVFDSEEPNNPKYARNRLQLRQEALEVRDITLKDVLLSTSAAPYFFPAHQVGNFSFHDGGVVANDPSLISASFGFRKFLPLTVGIKTSEGIYKETRQAAIKLLSVGCGLEMTLKEAFPKWKPQGIVGIIAEIADMFMSSDSDRTMLLSDELSQTNTLNSMKLNAVIPRAKDPKTIYSKIGTTAVDLADKLIKNEDLEAEKLPMHKVETVYAINALFARLDKRLDTMITIPGTDLLDCEKKMDEDTYASELVKKIDLARRFLEHNIDAHNTVHGQSGVSP